MEELGGKILTVVIPAYNMENYISKCCSSLVIDNNFGALEVLIINDGSTDMTSEIAHGFAKDYPEVFRVIDKENGNYGSCVNRGLGEARGVFIKILDGDDSFNNNEFEGYVRFLIDVERKFLDKVDLIITDRCIVDGDGVIKEQKSYDFSGEKIYDINKISCLKGAGITQHSVTYRTKKLVDMGYEQLEGVSYTDQEWVLSPLLSMENFIYYPHSIYLYLVGRAGQTIEPKTRMDNFWMQIIIKKHLLRFYVKKKDLYPTKNQVLVKKRLVHYLNDIYKYYLMENREKTTNEILKFDIFLKKEYPDFYILMEKVKYKKWYPVKYIKYWRAGINGSMWKYNMIYVIYSLLHKGVVTVKRIRNNLKI